MPLDVTGLTVTAVYSDGSKDAVTDYTLSGYSAEKLGKDTRTEWAQRRMYAMIADYTRAPNAKTMSDIRAFAERYGIEIPYEKEIK